LGGKLMHNPFLVLSFYDCLFFVKQWIFLTKLFTCWYSGVFLLSLQAWYNRWRKIKQGQIFLHNSEFYLEYNYSFCC
jgi:hypothetical protein